MTQNYSYNTLKNNTLSVTTFGIANNANKDFIVFVHGFKGFKDWGFGPYLAEYLANKGFFVVTFNFSHNGIDNKNEFSEIEKFASNTFTLELEELNEMIAACKSGYFEGNIPERIGLLGHSRGGGIALLSAAANDDVDCVTVWSSVSTFDRYTDRHKKDWREKGIFEVVNSRTKQVMKLNLTLLEDLEANKNDKLNILKAVEHLKKRLLIVHGEQDLAVPISEADEIYRNSDKRLTEYLKIAKTGHTFDIKHPFEGSNNGFDKVLDATANFFEKSFRKSALISG